jgi:hypothetical protein
MRTFKVDVIDARGFTVRYFVKAEDVSGAFTKAQATGGKVSLIEAIDEETPVKVTHGPGTEATFLRIALYMAMFSGFMAIVPRPEIGCVVASICLAGLAISASRE